MPEERTRIGSLIVSLGELDSAAHQVVEAQRVVRDAQAHGERFAGRAARATDSSGQRRAPAASGID